MKMYLSGVFCVLSLLTACHQNVSQKGMDKTDSLKIKVYDMLFKETDKSLSKEEFFDQPIENKFAKECIKRYKKEYGSIKSYTESVSFRSDYLNQWLLSRDVSTYKEIRMFLGIYTKEIIEKYGKNKNLIGKLSIFLWASPEGKISVDTINDNGDDFYNLGDIHPKPEEEQPNP